MITITQQGDFKATERYLSALLRLKDLSIFDKYGQKGVDALREATPVKTGLTADSWGYRIKKDGTGTSIEWYNTNVNDGVNIALILQMGHGTGTGSYIQGTDYINPALKPVFDELLAELESEVGRL